MYLSCKVCQWCQWNQVDENLGCGIYCLGLKSILLVLVANIRDLPAGSNVRLVECPLARLICFLLFALCSLFSLVFTSIQFRIQITSVIPALDTLDELIRPEFMKYASKYNNLKASQTLLSRASVTE